MGNSQSQSSSIPMPNFNENEYQKLKSIIGNAEQTHMNDFIPVSTELIKVFILKSLEIYKSYLLIY